MRVALVLAMLAGPCWAEPWIDYELLLDQNADMIVVSTDASGAVTRHLDLGDGVTVSCSDQGCIGSDPKLAFGCLWSVYASLLASAEVCGILETRTTKITDYHRLLTAFVARNAVPPRSVAEIETIYQELYLDRYRGSDGPLDCATVLAPDSDVMTLIDELSSSQLDLEAIEAGLARPRLPVMNPCL
ncbi:hypothetical protein MCELHM10_01952 [Paracoccaceae bacterium]|jgi:hypothetical protein